MGGDSGITDENKAILEKVRLNTRQEYLQGAASGSVRATDRLMRELQDIYRSTNFKSGQPTPPPPPPPSSCQDNCRFPGIAHYYGFMSMSAE